MGRSHLNAMTINWSLSSPIVQENNYMHLSTAKTILGHLLLRILFHHESIIQVSSAQGHLHDDPRTNEPGETLFHPENVLF